MIRVPLIQATPRPLNARLWLLVEREQAGAATEAETLELSALCRALETEQDNHAGAFVGLPVIGGEG